MIEHISQGSTLLEFTKIQGNPATTTLYRWMNASPELAGLYQRARDIGEEVLSMEALAIADDRSRDLLLDGKPNMAAVNRDKLRVDTRLRLLEKWNPKKWGAKAQVDVSGEVAIKRVVLDV
jgi:hypothetical protein